MGNGYTICPTNVDGNPRSWVGIRFLICPFCSQNDDKVIDSRTSDAGRAVRRRRVCNVCGKRFTTYERVEAATRLMVVKRDGSRQVFDPMRLLNGLQSACAKRPIPVESMQHLVDEVEESLYKEFDREVPSDRIGVAIMERLRHLDQVAYVRFASVYKEFQDLDDLLAVVQETKKLADTEVPGQGELFD